MNYNNNSNLWRTEQQNKTITTTTTTTTATTTITTTTQEPATTINAYNRHNKMHMEIWRKWQKQKKETERKRNRANFFSFSNNTFWLMLFQWCWCFLFSSFLYDLQAAYGLRSFIWSFVCNTTILGRLKKLEIKTMARRREK